MVGIGNRKAQLKRMQKLRHRAQENNPVEVSSNSLGPSGRVVGQSLSEAGSSSSTLGLILKNPKAGGTELRQGGSLEEHPSDDEMGASEAGQSQSEAGRSSGNVGILAIYPRHGGTEVRQGWSLGQQRPSDDEMGASDAGQSQSEAGRSSASVDLIGNNSRHCGTGVRQGLSPGQPRLSDDEMGESDAGQSLSKERQSSTNVELIGNNSRHDGTDMRPGGNLKEQSPCSEEHGRYDVDQPVTLMTTPRSSPKNSSTPKRDRALMRKTLFCTRSPKKIHLLRSQPGKLRTYGRQPDNQNQENINDPQEMQEQKPIVPEGRRLMTIKSMNNIMLTAAKHQQQCSNSILKIIKERRNGLSTTLVAQCERCFTSFEFNNDDGHKSLSVNDAAVWAGNTSGSGYTALKHSMVVLDIPFLSRNSYKKLEDNFSAHLNTAFEAQITLNGKAERDMAISLGQVADGYAWTDIIGDGQWSKRSFNQQGSALSGSAVGIGCLTRKPLFVGVRNKMCYICKTQPETAHDCFKNYEGSSSAMERDIIYEGFATSISRHSMRYKRYVGDGDSSVYAAIKDVYTTNCDPDRPYFTSVQKIFCRLHAKRVMNKNLLAAFKNSNRNSGYPKVYRDLLGERIHLFGKYSSFMVHRHIEDKPNTNSDTLRADLKALPYHIFGIHEKCSAFVCNNGNIRVPECYKRTKPYTQAKFKIPPNDFFRNPMWKEITDICNRLSELSTSLLYNLDTNIGESFQSHINKFANGRRSNIVMRGGYNRIVQEAFFSFMFGPTWYVNLYELVKFDEQPVSLWKRVQSQEQKITENRRQKPRTPRRRHAAIGSSKTPRYFSRTRKPEGDKDYGTNCERDDMDEDEREFRIQQFLAEKSVDNREDQWQLHLKTIGQHSNPEYVKHRSGLLTASIIGDMMKLRMSTPNVGILDKLLGPKDISRQPPIVWGHQNEQRARVLYEATEGVKVSDSGLFVCMSFAGLAASPDGLVDNDGILEIKCPYTERYVLPGCVADRKSNAYIIRKTVNGVDTYTMKKTSDYYLQVVQQLHITDRSYCDFVIWTQGALRLDESTHGSLPITPEGHLLCIRVMKDVETGKKWDEILLKATKFFNEDLGPELVDSRFSRSMGYLQPAYRQSAIDKAIEKKTKSAEIKSAKSGSLNTVAADEELMDID